MMHNRIRGTLATTGPRRAAGALLVMLTTILAALCGCSDDATAPPALLVDPLAVQLAPGDTAVSFEVRNSGGGTLTWDLVDDAPWLLPDIEHGSTADAQRVELTIDQDSLSCGPTIATVTLSSNGGSGRFRASMWVALTTAPAFLDLGDSEAGEIEISNDSEGSLPWTAVVDQPWLSVTPAGGLLPPGKDTLQVSVVPTGLAPGDYDGAVMVDAGALGRDTVQVLMTVPQTATVSGHVYYAATTIPIAEVIVSVGAIVDTTDTDGAYLLANVPAGARTIRAEKEDFADYQESLEVPDAGLTWDLVLTSPTHTHTLTGRTSNALGDGVNLADIILLNPDGSPSELATHSDNDGTYLLTGIPAGAREVLYTRYLYDELTDQVEITGPETAHDVRMIAQPLPPPLMPAGLGPDLTRFGCRSVHVQWTQRPEHTVHGYRVERATSGDGTYTEVSGHIAAAHDSYVDEIPEFGTYYYRVRTENIDGIIGGPSPAEDNGLTLNAWALLSKNVSDPDRRQRHSAIYDPVGDRMIMFAGLGCVGSSCGHYYNDTWAMDLSTYEWEELDSGTGPQKRENHIAVYDENRHRMLIFGGLNQKVGAMFNDTWAFDLTPGTADPWVLLDDGSSGPSARHSHTGVYTGTGDDRLIIYGGRDSDGALNDVWAFDPGTATWERILEGYYGELDPQPFERYSHTGVYDPLRQQMIVYGGCRSTSILYQDTWAFDLQDEIWIPLPDSPGPRFGHSALYDPIMDRMIVFGGWAGAEEIYNDLPVLVHGEQPYWEELDGGFTGPRPEARYFHSAIFDTHGDRILIYAGLVINDTADDTWAYCLSR